MKNFLLAFILSFLCFNAAIFAQEGKYAEKPYELKGVVKTADNAVFAGILLFFRNGDREESVSTDINGEFSIRLAPGNYEVKVRKSLSETFNAYFSIRENSVMNPQNVEFVVEPNRVCCGDSSEKPYPKITKLAKPPYPAAARAVQATGEVVVDVKIDKEGKIVEAKVTNGHPLLRSASVQAARQSLFEPSESDEIRDVKLTFVFLSPYNEKKLERYSNPYRVEIIGIVEIVDAAEVR